MGASFVLALAVFLTAPQSGQPAAVPSTAPQAVAIAPVPADAEIERFLREAEIVRTKGAKKGVTGTVRATLSDGRLTHDASIQSIDEYKREFRTAMGVEFDFRDSWMFNVAGYKIDRLIGLNMVPVSIARTHRSTPSAWTWWIDDVLMDEGERTKQKTQGPDPGLYSRQRAMMHLFDELISNNDRNQGNIIYTKDWRLWLIDHSRAFRKNTALKVPSHITRCDRQVFERLKLLDRETLKREVGKHLDDAQIKALLARRDVIVKKIESAGPSALFDRITLAVTPPASAAAR